VRVRVRVRVNTLNCYILFVQTLSDRNTVENMHGQILELREKLKNTVCSL
jgi:hypothetical protein